jgi:hypothetical protein
MYKKRIAKKMREREKRKQAGMYNAKGKEENHVQHSQAV